MRSPETRRRALLVHGHLDVVPATEAEWRMDPFGGDIYGSVLYGRGAVDMKHMLAMMLTAQEEIARGTIEPRRPMVFAYLADEEQGGRLGSRWLVAHRRDLLADVSEAVGEGGGHCVESEGPRLLYALAHAERGVVWARIRIPSAGGDTSMTRLGHLLGQLSAYAGWAAASEIDLTPTVVEMGSRSEVMLSVDCRVPPYQHKEGLRTLTSMLDADMTTETLMQCPGHTAPPSGPLFRACGRALSGVIRGARTVPTVFQAGSDAGNLSTLGIRCYGFTPLVTREPFAVWNLAHRPNEHVPVEALEAGYEVFRTLLALA
jgi:acetylornithine deacetylase/succinyl-diaminopimelate desuccinylase-like protein